MKHRGDKQPGGNAFGAGICLGSTLALSADSTTVLSGGICDANYNGAAWVFVP
jgi:hypothetical protein